MHTNKRNKVVSFRYTHDITSRIVHVHLKLNKYTEYNIEIKFTFNNLYE